MEISYRDSYDKIQEQLQRGGYESRAYRRAEAAFKIKSAYESTENTKRLVTATKVLAIFTILLFLSTSAYTWITFRAYKGSQKQAEALNELTKAINEAPKALIKFQQWSKARKEYDERMKKAPKQSQRALKKTLKER